MLEFAAFYGAIAGASAAIFGIGTAILAGRFVGLAERAVQLTLDHGDHVNARVGGDDLQHRWAARLRRDALADLHDLGVELRPAVAWPLGSAVVLVGVALAALTGWVPDTAWTRALLMLGVLVAALVWVFLLWRMMGDVIAYTAPHAMQRERRWEKSREAGDDFLVSGDPEALRGAHERLVRTFAPEYAKSLRGRFHLWLMRRRRIRRKV